MLKYTASFFKEQRCFHHGFIDKTGLEFSSFNYYIFHVRKINLINWIVSPHANIRMCFRPLEPHFCTKTGALYAGVYIAATG